MESVPVTAAGKTVANLRLSSEPAATMTLKPQGRDPRSETTAFHVESRQLIIARPGVIDGRHEFEVRPSRGLVKELTLTVPELITVGDVEGSIANWRFDAEQRKLVIVLEEAQSETFTVTVATQRTLADLPAEVKLEPLAAPVPRAKSDSSPSRWGARSNRRTVPQTASWQSTRTIFRFRISMKPSKRCSTASFATAPRREHSPAHGPGGTGSPGDQRGSALVRRGTRRLAAKMAIEISRAGLFQLGFAIPAGYEVETLSGSASGIERIRKRRPDQLEREDPGTVRTLSSPSLRRHRPAPPRSPCRA